jgi:hypothetical protein
VALWPAHNARCLYQNVIPAIPLELTDTATGLTDNGRKKKEKAMDISSPWRFPSSKQNKSNQNRITQTPYFG